MVKQAELAQGNATTPPGRTKLSEEELARMTLRQLHARCPQHRRYAFSLGGMSVNDQGGKLIVPYLSADDDQAAKTVAQLKAEAMKRRQAGDITFALDRLFEARGERYRRCTLENFDASTAQQRKAVESLKAYRAEIRDRITSGQNILLTGPSGTGKDHLLCGLMRATVEEFAQLATYERGDHPTVGKIVWTSGAMLWAEFRHAMDSTRESEATLTERYQTADVLVISDPQPVMGQLTSYQAATLYSIVDARYNAQSPVWVSINAANGAEAEAAIGVPIIDRLRDGALSLACSWPSYRKAKP